MLAGMIGSLLTRAIATGAPPGSQPSAGIRGEIVVAVVIVAGVFAYTWLGSRFVKMPSTPRGAAQGGKLGGRSAEPLEPVPLVDGLLRDLEAALTDRGMVREARRRVRLSRRSRPPGPAGPPTGPPGPLGPVR